MNPDRVALEELECGNGRLLVEFVRRRAIQRAWGIDVARSRIVSRGDGLPTNRATAWRSR
jgi:hypothetical protein